MGSAAVCSFFQWRADLRVGAAVSARDGDSWRPVTVVAYHAASDQFLLRRGDGTMPSSQTRRKMHQAAQISRSGDPYAQTKSMSCANS